MQRPNGKKMLRETALCGMFAALTAVISQLSLPIGPVPISCSMVAVYLTGLFLSVRGALTAQLVYIAVGLVGLPVYAGFQSGLGRLLGPTGGYLMMYPVTATIVAAGMLLYDRRLQKQNTAARLLYVTATLVLSLLVCYAGGAAWYAFTTKVGFSAALSVTVLPFIVGDACKIALCVFVAVFARPRMQKAVLKQG